jgi:hypothetical protein
MSVAQLTPQEFGCFVAICFQRLKTGRSLTALCELAELASSGNAGAFSAQYGEPAEVCTVAEIERAAMEYLAEKRDMIADHFGPLAYNMIANDGAAFLAPGVEVAQQADAIADIYDLEKKARAWQDGERRALKRAEEDAVSFDDVGQLPTLSKAEIEAKRQAAGADRVIFAEFCVNESDLMADYFGGRTSRVVVIGFGKGKRENFRQLRAAAGKFPPTAFMGPGLDAWTASLVWDHDKADDPQRAFIAFGKEWDPNQPQNGCGVVFHYYSRHYCEGDTDKPQDGATLERFGFGFNSKTDAENWIAKHPPLAGTEWRLSCESYENRENYSMGGGNYLGTSRYGGWKVRSSSLWQDRYEFWK